MSGPVNVASPAEWQSLLSENNVVVADFYADWCGPCKMIAPHYEKLAKEHSRPKKMAFAKVNVDNQSTISRAQGVAAMPTFKIYHGGNCVETLKGANPSALTEAVGKAAKLAEMGAKGAASEVFKTPGRTLAGAGGSGGGGGGAPSFNFSGLINILVAFIGLYLWSLFSARNNKEE